MNRFLIFPFLIVCILFTSQNLFSGVVIDSLKNETERSKNDSSLIKNYYKLSEAYRNEDLMQSVKYAEKGMELSFLVKDPIHYAQGLFLSGVSYSDMGLNRNAIDRITQAKEIFEITGDTHKVIESEINIGNIFWLEQDYAMALTIYKNVLSLSEKENRYKWVVINMNIAISYSNLNIPDSAFLIFDLLKSKIREFSDDDKSFVFFNIGSTYLFDHQNDSAHYYLRLAEQLQDGLPRIVLLHLKASQAQCNMRLGRVNSANAYLDTCRALALDQRNNLGLKEYYQTKFEIDTALRNFESAIESHIDLMRIKDTIFQHDQVQLLANYKAFYNLNLKDTEILNLKKDNELISIKSNKNKFIIIALFVIIGLVIGLTLVYMRLNKIQSKSILTLNDLNGRMVSQQNKLTEQNQELERTLKQLKDAQTQLVQSEKHASIGILAAGVAHEINNPLNYINGGLLFLEEIKDDLCNKDNVAVKIEESYNMMRKGIEKATSVVQTLGTYAFAKDSDHKELDLNVVVNTVISSLRFKMRSDIHIALDLEILPLIICDEDKLNAIIIHVLSNAIDAVRPGKQNDENKIGIKTSVSVAQGLGYVVLSVSNTGDGISDENINRLFDPFFTTKDPDKGYGLGLSIAYNLVQELNGLIMVNNIEDGVEFVVKFPVE